MRLSSFRRKVQHRSDDAGTQLPLRSHADDDILDKSVHELGC